jgi:hypothetical protein
MTRIADGQDNSQSNFGAEGDAEDDGIAFREFRGMPDIEPIISVPAITGIKAIISRF